MRQIHVKNRFVILYQLRRKTLEVRIESNELSRITIGECIELASRSNVQTVRVIAIRKYPTTQAVLQGEDVCNIIPDKRRNNAITEFLAAFDSVPQGRCIIVFEMELVEEKQPARAAT